MLPAEAGHLIGRRLRPGNPSNRWSATGGISIRPPSAGCCCAQARSTTTLAAKRAAGSLADPRDRPGRAAFTRWRPRNCRAETRPVPGRGGGCLGPGGARQYGRLANHGPPSPRTSSVATSGPSRSPRVSAPAARLRQTPHAAEHRLVIEQATGPRLGCVSCTSTGPRHRGTRAPAPRKTRSPWAGWRSDSANFVDLNPESESTVDRLATWLARLDDDEADDEYKE